MRPHYSHSSRENATPSSGTSLLASCKGIPPRDPVVERDGVIGVREVLFDQFFSFVQRLDPVKQHRSIFWGSDISGLVSFESFVLPFFLRGQPLGHR